jgi:hypothetical protein
MNSESLQLPSIPNDFNVTIKSWHDGSDRKYVCTLSRAGHEDERWTSQVHDSVEAAMAAALTASHAPAVDGKFWLGVRSAVPLALLSWVAIAFFGMMVWRWLS